MKTKFFTQYRLFNKFMKKILEDSLLVPRMPRTYSLVSMDESVQIIHIKKQKGSVLYWHNYSNEMKDSLIKLIVTI